MKTFFTAAICVAATVICSPVQSQSATGIWDCSYVGNRTIPNQPPVSQIWNFAVQLDQNGTAYAQGVEIAQGMQHPFEAQAQWRQSGQEVHMQGTKQGGAMAAFFASNGMPAPPEAAQFFFSSLMQGDGFMNWEQTLGDQQTGISRFQTQCRRRQ